MPGDDILSSDTAQHGQLGQPVASFRSSWLKNWLDLCLGVPLAALPIVGFVRELSPPIKVENLVLLPLFLIAGAMGGWFLWRAYQRKQDSVTVFKNGISLKEGKTSSIALWNEVRTYSFEYFYYRYVNRQRVLTLDLHDGGRIFIWSHLCNFDQLVSHVQNRLDDIILAKSKKVFEEMEIAQFGNLTMNPRGITYDDEHLNWEDVSSVHITEDGIEIKEKGAEYAYWCLLSLESGPNPDEFVKMAEQLLDRYGTHAR